MLHPLHVVTVWIILMRVCTSRLLSILCRNHFLHGLVEQILEFECLDQIRIPDHTAVLDSDIFILLHDVLDRWGMRASPKCRWGRRPPS